ncbi:hypothetical protein GCM10011579_083680 [Streptomyces albiflavescens]|uniref:Uncharacterized protein n=1 Tax=Streptomyces albiflavescens TaxID=1623582 RepID=A0A918D9R0_9ACTN|nr:hypothetical protein GCM10011579_083680 [Streptomyces albiflavescens]
MGAEEGCSGADSVCAGEDAVVRSADAEPDAGADVDVGDGAFEDGYSEDGDSLDGDSLDGDSDADGEDGFGEVDEGDEDSDEGDFEVDEGDDDSGDGDFEDGEADEDVDDGEGDFGEGDFGDGDFGDGEETLTDGKGRRVGGCVFLSWWTLSPLVRAIHSSLWGSKMTNTLMTVTEGATTTTFWGRNAGHESPVGLGVVFCWTGSATGLPHAHRTRGTPRESTRTEVPAWKIAW